jgi:hypothetical protein
MILHLLIVITLGNNIIAGQMQFQSSYIPRNDRNLQRTDIDLQKYKETNYPPHPIIISEPPQSSRSLQL